MLPNTMYLNVEALKEYVGCEAQSNCGIHSYILFGIDAGTK